jgi:hypothetical protein
MPVFTKNIELSEDFPTIRPTLNLNFTGARDLDARVTFARASIGTYVGSDGLIKTAGNNEARFDHDPDTLESLGLLIEESRTNSLPYSSDIVGQSNWLGAGVSAVAATSITAPDGSTDTVGLRDDGSNGQHTLYDDVSVSDITSTYTASCWVKEGTKDFAELFANGAGTPGAITIAYKYDLVNKTVEYTGAAGFSAGTSATITEYHNGWFRITITGDVAGTSTGAGTYRFHIRARTDTTGNYQGDNTDGIYIWGPQVELGSFPTSYIPTSGAALTRNDDIGSIIGDDFTSFFNQSEGTFDVGYRLGENNVGMRLCQITNGSASTIIDLVAGSGSGLGGYWFIKTGTTQFSSPTTDNSTQVDRNFRSVLAYKENDCAAQNNKTPAGPTTDTSVTLASNYNQLLFYQIANGEDVLQGHIKFIRYYPKRLTDAQVTLFSQD